MNPLNTQMRAEITHAARESRNIACVIFLTGTGSAFCSGQDPTADANPTDIDLERKLNDEHMPMLEVITTCPIPMVAAVNDLTISARASLALAADVVIGAESAHFL